MADLFDNRLLLAAVIAAGGAQVIKVGIALLSHERGRAFSRLLETGGMPSSHTAGVTSLAVGSGILYGFQSPIFAICAVFGYIVVYDAMGIRRQAGVHAELLNELVEELRHVLDDGFQPESLRTLLGHTVPQVIGGLIIGVLTGWLFCR